MGKKRSEHASAGGTPAEPVAPRERRGRVGPSRGRTRAFIEMCGRHPFATGLFAILGVFGLGFSLFAFGVDQIQSWNSAEETAGMQKSLNRMENTVAIIAKPKQEPANFDPVESTQLEISTITDNAIFPQRYMGRSRNWIQANVEESFSEIPFLSFSLKSAANKDFLQIAPYLLIDVAAVDPIGPDLAAIYQGERGGAAQVREFSAAVIPKVGLQFAPLVNGDDGTFRTDVDFFSLMPREPEEFFLGINFVPGYIYTFRIGIHYKYKDRHGVHWLNQPLRAGVPTYELPVAGFDELDFQTTYYPDFHDDTEALTSQARENLHAVYASKVFKPSQISNR